MWAGVSLVIFWFNSRFEIIINLISFSLLFSPLLFHRFLEWNRIARRVAAAGIMMKRKKNTQHFLDLISSWSSSLITSSLWGDYDMHKQHRTQREGDQVWNFCGHSRSVLWSGRWVVCLFDWNEIDGREKELLSDEQVKSCCAFQSKYFIHFNIWFIIITDHRWVSIMFWGFLASLLCFTFHLIRAFVRSDSLRALNKHKTKPRRSIKA